MHKAKQSAIYSFPSAISYAQIARKSILTIITEENGQVQLKLGCTEKKGHLAICIIICGTKFAQRNFTLAPDSKFFFISEVSIGMKA